MVIWHFLLIFMDLQTATHGIFSRKFSFWWLCIYFGWLWDKEDLNKPPTYGTWLNAEFYSDSWYDFRFYSKWLHRKLCLIKWALRFRFTLDHPDFWQWQVPVVVKNPCKIWITPSKPPKTTNMSYKISSRCTSEDVFSWVWFGFVDNVDFKAHNWYCLDWHFCQKSIRLRRNILYPTYISVTLVFLGDSLSGSIQYTM